MTPSTKGLMVAENGSQAGWYADTLRALGRQLDQIGAAEITIFENATTERAGLSVSWTARAATGAGTGGKSGPPRQESQWYDAAALAALREAARHRRDGDGLAVRFTLQELLRTVGAMVDDTATVGVCIAERPEGFRLTAYADGEEFTVALDFDELVSQSMALRRRRTDEQTSH